MEEIRGRERVVIESVVPEIDCGRFPIKRTLGERVRVEADVFCDGHDAVSVLLIHRKRENRKWKAVPMKPLGNDRWQGEFEVTALGCHEYTLVAWVDRFKTWRRDLVKKVEARLDVSLDLKTGAELIRTAAGRAPEPHAGRLASRLQELESGEEPVATALSRDLEELMFLHGERRWPTVYERRLEVVVDREKARFSAWYEIFPRSCAQREGRHGTLKDCRDRLPEIARMGFDVLYLPPIHPIGLSYRKGRNNTTPAQPGDPGSPWAIGAGEGGHKSVHPELGDLKDFQDLVAQAETLGLEIAMDLAFQCSPDHPYVRSHPEWFRAGPDGSIQYAENPPKKYQDIYPLDFESEQWRELWEELKGVVLFWIEQGIRMFRVDNPHTKPLRFWEWLIGEIKSRYPEVLFLSEAFTRPKVMYRLAKVGFSQSYTYFTWRNTAWEISEYFSELARTGVREYFRPNLWPNTPDILTEYLQMGGRPAFVTRLVLAATLGASYGIYGPAFELCEDRPLERGREEYLDSEKYEIRHWSVEDPGSLRDMVVRINRIRRENPALRSDRNLRFHRADNEQIICYSKHTDDFSNIVLVVVNLDPHHTHEARLSLPLPEMGLENEQAFQLHDQLSEMRLLWQGPENDLSLDPGILPAHIFRIRRKLRTERDFDYFM
ncbi:MAG: alpha-1,4-glucan--maltose-1-phosphate maltosyltransferase [Desulfatiglandales bacterium]